MALGGGVHNRPNGMMTIEYSTISQNTSAANAGGIVNAGTMRIVGSTIAQNTSVILEAASGRPWAPRRSRSALPSSL